MGWTEREIPAGGCAEMEIEWTPRSVWTTRETIQFTDNRKFKKDVGVIMKSVNKQQANGAMKKMMSGRLPSDHRLVTTKLTLKSPSPRTKQRMRLFRANEKRKSRGASPQAAAEKGQDAANRKVLGVQNKIDARSGMDLFDGLALGNEKENQCPTTPKNSANIFDTFKLTPANRTVNRSTNVDFLASLPTPNSTVKGLHRDEQSIFDFNLSPTAQLRETNGYTLNETTTIETNVNICDQTTDLYNMRTPNSRMETSSTAHFEHMADCTQFALQQTPGGASTVTRTTLFTMSETETFERKVVIDSVGSPVCRSPANRTHLLSSPVPHLSVIEEEVTRSELSETFVKVQSDHQRTYSVVATPSPVNLLREVAVSGTPLRKKFQSMKELSHVNGNLEQQCLKSNQGSMPNLNKIEKLSSIESNRYFYQSVEKDLQIAIDEEPEDERSLHGDGEFGHLDNSICSIKSTMSTVSTAFQENEILAQSSQFNLNELGRPSIAFAKPTSFYVDSHDPKPRRKPSAPPHLSASSPSLSREANTSSKLTRSTRDLRANKTAASRPSVISYARGKSSAPSTPGSKRNRDDSLDHSRKSLKQSPPKRMCLESESPQPGRGQAFRTSTWGGTMPKKFRVPSVPVQRLLLKRPSDERVILYDPELHIKGKPTLLGSMQSFLNLAISKKQSRRSAIPDSAICSHSRRLLVNKIWGEKTTNTKVICFVQRSYEFASFGFSFDIELSNVCHR